ncbi:MAG: sugar phosphate isomerase/epimerase [Candidatus Hydrogenedentes bacterium]|nr:sugar phosphate isomerase/epimerase [Candidatus Hydrogenedentota bacterium]
MKPTGIPIGRREFVEISAATTIAVSAGVNPTTPGEKAMKGPQICVFSKHLQFLGYNELAKVCKEIKVDGVDLTVRKGGHVTPDKLDTDLPRAVEAIRGEELDVPMISSALFSGNDPDARPIISAAAKLGIRYVRVGGQKYSETGNPADELPKFTAELKSLAALAKEMKVELVYHNHSGMNTVSAPIWDLYSMYREIGLDSLGSSFDVSHATIEGGLGGWNLSARLMAAHTKVMAVKDFIWKDKELHWCPLGEGQVKTVAMLKILKDAGFAGPISMHFEYKTPSNDSMIEEVRKTALTLRGYLAEVGYA